MKSPIVLLALILGLIFAMLGVYYFMTPADQLAAFIPGYDPAMTTIHLKHGIAAIVLAVACFIFAWFKSAPKAR
jgi:uncharacterized membrane protein